MNQAADSRRAAAAGTAGGRRAAAAGPPPPWRSAPRRRGITPRPPLSREVIVDAALAVIEGGGGSALTMRRVADQIGVSASALYGYVANKEELVQLVFERIIAEIPDFTGDGDWRDMMRESAREMLAIFRRHPGVAGLTLGRVPLGPAMMAGAEKMLARLRAAGLPDQVAAFAGDLGSLYVGAYAYELDVAPPDDQAEFAGQFAGWLKSLPRQQFPNLVALAGAMTRGSAEDRFEWGLDVLIRGLASYLTDPPGPEARWPEDS